MKKKNIILLVITIVLFLLVGSTMAYFGWSSTSENKDQTIDVTISSGTGSCDKLSDNQKSLYPTSSKNNGRILTVKAKQMMAPNAIITWKLKINSINESTLTTSGLKHKTFKYELVNSNTGVSYGTGNFENVSAGDIITLSTTEETLDYNTEYTFTLYLWIDGTIGTNSLDMNNQPYDFDLSCSITGTGTKKSNATPISDFEYYLGSEYQEIDTIEYYYEEYGQYYDISVAPMELETNEVLLTKYIGSSPNVSIPNTYEVNGTTYNVVVLSWAYIYYYDDDINVDIDTDDGIFEFNTEVENVNFGSNIKFIYNNRNGENSYDRVINNSMVSMFYGCTSLVSVSGIPSSVTNMEFTFQGCTSLVNAPEIPSSVTNMYGTFNGCTNLTGTVKINSSNVSYVDNIFSGTTKNITVQVPSGSTTYTKLNALTTSNGKPANVTLTTFTS